ncbi:MULTISPECIES: BMC domain-containing protein [Lysinibacillus]|uniref:BMC domain-containing protein n=1 Tax=Lysinibacillus pakistanensis TaxID=759811 RepID=A0AAX3X3M9_9BACI|nr:MULTISPECIES: BMC domain-containing protein [Lysinibacillus]MDM5233147.1 BMC domain-containing protein [Lysinibacillus pakistanensis]QGG51266.1 BMC domain-containing protein [Lysinibacillus pakistanensis]WHY48630.1 BMC domain-containing protein [Lysinibacillus pakistanensis]WHY53643.1 BMC domain-containing protein [Lysinibacillus pakistanensis]
MTKSIGIVETRGLAISIQIADAMLKGAAIRLLRQETIDLALVTIAIEGDTEAIREAIEIGTKMAKAANQWIASTTILRPEDAVNGLVMEIAKKPT